MNKKIMMLCGILLVIIPYLVSTQLFSYLSKTEQPISEQSTSEQVMTGKLILGHEVAEFGPCNSDKSYWIEDETGQLEQQYRQTMASDAAAYTPVYALLKVIEKDRAEDGFASDYDGVMKVINIVEIKALPENLICP